MSMKRISSLLMLVVMLAALLAACGSPDAGSTGAQSTTAAGTGGAAATTAAGTGGPAATTAAGTGGAAETATAGTGGAAETATAGTGAATETAAAATPGADATAAGGAAEDLPNVAGLNLPPVKIASQSPLSGPQSALGTGIRNGVELAVEQIGERLGLNVTLEAKDDQATPDVGAANANQIAADQDILCVAGHLNSGVALAALPTYKSAGLTMVTPANTNVRITDEFGGTAWRVVGRDDVQGGVAGKFAADQGYKTAYVLHDKTDYGLGVAEFFRAEAERGGVQIVGFEGTEETAVFDPILNPILAQQPEAVFWGGIYSAGGPLLKQMRDKGIQAAFLGTDGLDSPVLVELAGEAAVGVQYVTIAGPPSEYPGAAQLATDYQARFNAPAPPFSPQAYDAAGICLTAIAKAAQAANGKPTRQQVNDAMKEMTSYEGVTGTVNFDEKGDRVPATYFILKVTSGDPAKFGESEIVSKLELGPAPQ